MPNGLEALFRPHLDPVFGTFWRTGTSVIRVGFLAPFYDSNWLGGVSYFRNLLGALSEYSNNEIEPVLLVGNQGKAAMPGGFENIATRVMPSLRKGSMPWFCRKLIRTHWMARRLMRRDLIAAEIPMLSHSGHLGRQKQIATLAWIPDFQHRYFPDFFSPDELAARNKEYMQHCRYATRIIVSSNAAQRDLAEFCQSAVHKSRVLQFVADVPNRQMLPSKQAIQRRYNLPDHYFLLPNHFWKHKNHELVLHALAILRSRGTPALVVATGNPNDYRQPAHFQSLIAYSRAHSLGEDFRVLGIVPLDDLMALMWNSVAVINPSRFEGWSTSVEEGKSMGKSILLSSIPVHIEQAPARSSYFDPDDPSRLAELMVKALADWDPNIEIAASEEARENLPRRRREFAFKYREYVVECFQ